MDQPVQTNAPYESKGISIVSSLLIIVILLLITQGVWMIFQKKSIADDIANRQAIIDLQLREVEQEDNLEVSPASKKLYLNDKRAEQIFWTNVLVKFRESIPESVNLKIKNFSANSDGVLSFAANTNENSVDPYLDTALLIETLKLKPFFDNVFVPSVTSTLNEQGKESLSYTTRLNYLKDANDTDLIDLSEDFDLEDDFATETDPAVSELLEELKELSEPAEESEESETDEESNEESDE